MNKCIGKVMLLAAFAVGSVCMSGAVANAEVGYCSGVTVKKAGGSGGSNVVALTNNRTDCGNFVKDATLWFTLDSTGKDALLASALTALSLGKPVTIVSKTSDVYTNWGTITLLTVGP